MMQLTEEQKEVQERLLDPWWRLNNLYHVMPEGGGSKIPFRPRAEQQVIYRHLLETPHLPAYIIKSRRLGFSTALGVFAVDKSAWNLGQKCMLVDMTQPDAWKKMREIIRYAFDTMPAHLKQTFSNPKREDSQLSIRAAGEEEEKDSHIYAGMNARGGDCSMLWVSEWGKFQNDAKHSERSEEISKGAWNTARKGIRVVETTWEGGRNGELWEIIKPILDKKPNAEGKIYFFPWHADPSCVSVTGEVTDDVQEYFREIEAKLGKQFKPDQKKWWAVTKTQQRQHMKTEFPSTLEEALSSPGMHPRFSEDGLDWMEKQMRDTPPLRGHIKHDKETQAAALIPASSVHDDTAWWREWEPPTQGMSYVIPIDFCTAVQVVEGNPDSHALPVLRDAYMTPSGAIKPIRTVGAITIDNRTTLGTFVRQIAAVACYYGSPVVIPEINNMRGIIELMRQAGVTNIYERTLNPDSKGDKRMRKEPGWETTTSSKPVAIAKLAQAIDDMSLVVECSRMLLELRMFQDTNEAASGFHDDWVMALAIGVTNMRFATRYVARRAVVAHTQMLSDTERMQAGLPPSVPGNWGGFDTGAAGGVDESQAWG